MLKLAMLSIVLSGLAVPLLAARDNNARRGLRRAVFGVLLFNAFYVGVLTVFWPHLEKSL